MKAASIFFPLVVAVFPEVVCPLVFGGTYNADFSAAPSPAWSVWSSSPQSGVRVASGGNAGGQFVLTPAAAGERCVVVLPDLDGGNALTSFDLSMDCRVGGGTAVPADGMSVSFARSGDAVLAAGTGFSAGDAPEEGTESGISVCMDAYDNGGTDWVGFTVKRDGVVIAQAGADLRNGALTEAGSLQTGPRNTGGGDTAALLGWARLRVVLNFTGRLDVYWKNVRVINGVQTHWVPSGGRFVIGARTGSFTQVHAVDNLTVTTGAGAIALSEVTARPRHVQFAFTDASGAVPAGSIVLRVNGNSQAITPVQSSGSLRRFAWIPIAPLIPGATYTYTLTGNGGLNAEGTFRAPVYPRITPEMGVSLNDVDTTVEGVRIATWQTVLDRPASVEDAEEQVRGRFGANVANLTTADAEGKWTVPFVNFEENGSAEGYFTSSTTSINGSQDRTVPGIPGGRGSGPRDYFAVEAVAWVQLSSGTTRMGVRSDDGFRLTCGPDGRSPLAMEIARYDGARAAGDTEVDVYVDAPGYYPFRLLWYEATGGASCEWYVKLDDGRRIPVGGMHGGNLSLGQAAAWVTCYPKMKPSYTPPRFVDWVSLPPGSTGAAPGEFPEILLSGARLPLPAASIDGQPATVRVSSRGGAELTIEPQSVDRFWVDPGATHTVAVNVDGLVRSWSFTRAAYGVLPEASWTRPGSGRTEGFSWRVVQTSQPHSAANDASEEILGNAFPPNLANGARQALTGAFDFSHDGSAAGLFATNRPMPGLASPYTNAAVESLAYLELPAPGFHTLGVNSDDGFRLSAYAAPRSALRITSPANFAGEIPAVESLNAPADGAAVTGVLAVPVPADASSPLSNAAQIAGKIALVDRSDSVLFSDQIRRCQNAGALGVVVINNNSAPSVVMTGRGFPEFTIPAVMLNQVTGAFIKLNPSNFTVSLGRDTGAVLGEYDGPRAPGSSKFTFFAPAAGLYPVRLLYTQAGGGGALEFFHYETNGNGPAAFGGTALAGAVPPRLWQFRLEPVEPISVDYLRTTRLFRAWLPLGSSDLLHVRSSTTLDAWSVYQESVAAPASGSPWTYQRPFAPAAGSARQYFLFEVRRSLP